MSGETVAKEASMTKSLRQPRLVLAFLCVVGVLAGGYAWWTYDRLHRAMREIESQIVAGQYAIACRNLERLLSWKSDPTGEIVYRLGSCELARGRKQAASTAWSRVLPGSAFTGRAIEGRMQLLIESGQLTAAERLVIDTASDPRNDGTALLVLLTPMYSLLGRIDEAECLIEDRWEYLHAKGEGALEPAIKLVLEHIELGLKGNPVETIRDFLERASQLAPDDDRVWLGRANLAIRTGAHDEAERYIDACQVRRPDDVPVWRARLSWGIATNRVDVVKQAMTHLPGRESDPGPLHRQNAWLAAHRRDLATERRELELLLASDPADVTALGRLAQLAEKEGQHDQTAEFLRRKADTMGRLARYRELHDRTQPFRDAVEMARLAEQLGRHFEARVFLTIAVSDEPARREFLPEIGRFLTNPTNAGTITLTRP